MAERATIDSRLESYPVVDIVALAQKHFGDRFDRQYIHDLALRAIVTLSNCPSRIQSSAGSRFGTNDVPGADFVHCEREYEEP